ncbi:EscU/YscU/HrcU family type III secretion system export apparatus switch protein [Bacillus sp. CGMCC 1.16541]|uniref:EscU/YscU/HrcU family type III secretion system export apparatus switch protein n=1 Tax=Bacillus sp. CGMCC 1.16541 TaxID=2185143 RepID=UPI000D73ED11|nr:EscU/YscU/HrcU family type III secretion system export apparatus switch protein [Bacillus sp. CGMCC 1.16541]
MKSEEKRKQAVVLSYESLKDEAPQVVAKGKGFVADNIISEAKSHGIPIQEDATLVELLGQLTINEKIPEELYQAVAEIFSFVYKIDKQMKRSYSGD